MKNKYDVAIIGAGPAGLTAALTLGRAGFNVIVKEARRDVGLRPSGGFQILENWSRDEKAPDFLKRIGVKTNFLFDPSYSFEGYCAFRKRRKFSSSIPFFYLMRRGAEEGCLDAGLKEQVLDAGITIEFGECVEKTSGPSIIATGPKFPNMFAMGYVFKTDIEDVLAIIFDDELDAGGYSYFLAKNGNGTIASGFFSGFGCGKGLRERMERSVAAFKELYDFRMNDKKQFTACGNIFFPKHYHTAQKYYVGESAGLQDYLWGCAIRTAMHSGFLAAQAIIKSSDYDASIRKHILPWMKASASNRFVFSRMENKARSAFIDRMKASRDPRNFMHELYSPSLLKALICPIALTYAKLKSISKNHNHIDCECTLYKRDL